MHIHILGICGTFFWVDTGIALLRAYTTTRLVMTQKIVRTVVS
jgi:hypothetical protein